MMKRFDIGVSLAVCFAAMIWGAGVLASHFWCILRFSKSGPIDIRFKSSKRRIRFYCVGLVCPGWVHCDRAE